MNIITTYNYEAYLLDSLEGNLTPELAAELVLFFENNPYLKEDIDGFDLLKLTPEKPTFLRKQELKKGAITSANYEEYIVSEIDRENNKEEHEELAFFIKQNPLHQKQFDDYLKTKLLAPNVVFNGKEGLKRKGRKIIPLYWWVGSVAAILLTMLFLKGLVINDEMDNRDLASSPVKKVIQQQVASTKTVAETTPVKIVTSARKEQKKFYKKKDTTLTQEDIVLSKDTLEDKNIQELIEIPVVQKKIAEEVLPANTDNVKITYIEEEKEQVLTSSLPQKKKKKKGLFKKIFNSQVRDKVREKVMQKEVNQDGEIVAYALNVGGVSLYRKKLK